MPEENMVNQPPYEQKEAPQEKPIVAIDNISNETKKKEHPYLIPASIIIAGILIATAVVVTQGPGLFSKKSSGLPYQEPTTPRDASIDLEQWPSLGNPEAKVVIVEYSDFACPFCKQLHDQVFPLVKERYIDTGEVRFVYKDFIVVGGDRAAEAAHCANEQNAFWQYHDLLFEKQPTDRSQWSRSEVHRQYAQELGLDANDLVSCFESRRYQEKVSASTREGYANGGQGTPFTLVNGTPVSGAQPFSAFQTIIESELVK